MDLKLPKKNSIALRRSILRLSFFTFFSLFLSFGMSAQYDLKITELFPGQSGTDLTADWIEIRNAGTASWVRGEDPDLYYDDESADSVDAAIIEGIDSLAPSEYAIVVLDDNASSVDEFIAVWSPVIDLSGIAIGLSDGKGLGGGGDAATLWVGDPSQTDPVDYQEYPDIENFDGQSYDVELSAFSEEGNANGAVATLALGGDNGDVRNIASPANAPAIARSYDLKITELFPGQSGPDLTADWIEIRNAGTASWVRGEDPDLYYDDESADSADAVIIEGIDSLAPGEYAVVVLDDNASSVDEFIAVWSPVIDQSGIAIGLSDGKGLGGSGDAATLWVGDPSQTDPVDYQEYPDIENFDGQSYDVELSAFSEEGNANGAVTTLALGGDNGDVPNVGSPGNGSAILNAGYELRITELFPGQSGSDLTEDWIEVTNVGEEAWIQEEDPELFYDDESTDPADATLIEGISQIEPGEHVIVVLTNTISDVNDFAAIWGEVIDLSNVQIGYTDGKGLGGGGDAATLWVGDPSQTDPVDYQEYPDTENFDGQSYDVELAAFSEEGNANGAVTTLALGGGNGDIPNVGSPGNGAPISLGFELEITELYWGQSGSDLTSDWIEIRNSGNVAWVRGEDPDLYYDDESTDPFDAVLIEGIDRLEPGAYAIALISSNSDDIQEFFDIWSPVVDLSEVTVGITDGSGLSSNGDGAALWVGNPMETDPVDYQEYPSPDGFDGQSWDVKLAAFSEEGNASGAVVTIALGGSTGNVPNIASPGNVGATSAAQQPAMNWRVYPNPARDRVFIHAESPISEFRLYDSFGRKVRAQQQLSAREASMQLGGLPSGLYYLNAVADGYLYRRALIIQ